MKQRILFALAAVSAAAMLTVSAHAKDLSGAGGTAIYPVLSQWADTYQKATGTAVNYQAIGSGGGIKQIQAKTVDFANSDKPLKPEDLDSDERRAIPDGDHLHHPDRQPARHQAG